MTSVPGSRGVNVEPGAPTLLHGQVAGRWGGGSQQGMHLSSRGTEQQEGMGSWSLSSVCPGLGLLFSPVGCQDQCLAHPMLPFYWGGFHLEAVRIPTGTGV